MKEQLITKDLLKKQNSEMLLSYFSSTREYLSRADDFIKDPRNLRVGLEIEYSVLTKEFSQATESDRNEIIKHNPNFFDFELGAAQLETKTSPIYLNQSGFKTLESMISNNEKDIREIMKKDGLSLLSSGSNPFVLIPDIKISNKEKYQKVPSYHNNNKRANLETIIDIGNNEFIDVNDASIISLTNSVQCNIEASGFKDAINKTNKSFAIGPMAVALSANARFLEEKDSKISDIRMIAWEKSHDTRTDLEVDLEKVTRIGLPDRYYHNMNDYFSKVGDYPFILHDEEHAFQIAIGLNWRDTRIKFTTDNSVLVEFRPVSTQPTPAENIAIMLFYIGRLNWSTLHDEPLMDLKLVKKNRDQAMYYGLKANLWTNIEGSVSPVILPAKAALSIELKKSHEGLSSFGFSKQEIDNYLSILEKRIKNEETPSDKLVTRFYDYRDQNCSKKDSLVKSLKDQGGLI